LGATVNFQSTQVTSAADGRANRFLNPPINLLFAAGLVPPGYALLETWGAGRESRGGRRQRRPHGRTVLVIAERGTLAGYVRNIARIRGYA
jgi:hypothetical protein